MEIKRLKPHEIEQRSFEIISAELAQCSTRQFAPEEEPVVKRVIHTSADFEYAQSLEFSPGAVSRGTEALRRGAHIVTDTTMALSGISKMALRQLGGEAHCFIADSDVAARAKQDGDTRSAVSMEKAAELGVPLIFAIGNAPTALIRLNELIAEGRVEPELIVGVPVGFVNVVESKELFIGGKTPYIISHGRKGGSNVAAAIINALLYQIITREGF